MILLFLSSFFHTYSHTKVSRSMLNFGLTELRLVDPRCDHLSEASQAIAAGSYEILENAKIYSSLDECTKDLQKVYATTVRPRHMTQMIYTPQKAAETAVFLVPPKSEDGKGGVDTVSQSGIMFGTERSGLTNEEVAYADSIITIPSFKHFSSLNLAQAVNIVGYEMWKRALEVEQSLPPGIHSFYHSFMR